MISALGQCPIHHIDRMSVGSNDFDGEAICVKCKADAEPKLGRTQVVEDPGEEFFKTGRTNAKITIVKPGVAEVEAAHKAVAPQVVLAERAPLSDYIEKALEILSHAPMPHDIKQFKNLQKVTGILKGLLENQNG